MEQILVGILTGSESDLPIIKKSCEILKSFEIKYEVLVRSAHRTPDETLEYVENAHKKGIEVLIAAAGLAAHLPGVVAAKTHLPVIGIPIASQPLNGLDALMSIVQMPKGVPVGTVGIGNGENAALLAARILANKYPEIKEKVLDYMEKQRQKILSIEVGEI